MKKILLLLLMAITVQLTAQIKPTMNADSIVTRASESKCNCGRWTAQNVIISSKPLNFNTVCGGTITLPIAAKYQILVPVYNCNKPSCFATYKWDVQGPGPVDGNSIGRPFEFNFSASGTYAVTITPICGMFSCPPCAFKVIIP